MSEVLASTTTTEDVVDVVEAPIDPVESQAREQGWVSKEEWVAQGKPESEHRSAKEFVERGELYKSIHNTKRELRQTQAALDSLAKHHRYVFEKAYQDAKRDLQMEKRLAIRNEDFEHLEEVEGKLEQLNEQHAMERVAFEREQVAARHVGPPPELVDWMEKNQWYVTDQQLRDEADAVGFVYLNKGGSKEGLLAHVEKKVKEKFPEKFGGRRAAPNAVAGVDRTSGKSRTPSVELSELETKIMNDLVKSGVMTKDEYIKELKRVK